MAGIRGLGLPAVRVPRGPETAKADARRTARIIVRHLVTLAYEHGWISREAALEAPADLAKAPQ